MKPESLSLDHGQIAVYAERFVRSIKHECLDRLILLGEEHLRSATSAYSEHYNRERNHEGMENQLLTAQVIPLEGEVRCRKRLGGLLNYYYREAA